MIKHALFAAMLVTGLCSAAARAEPITLKLSLVTSDRALIYLACVKPFVDAVNSDPAGLLKIDIYFSGALEKQWASQPQLVSDGKADLAFIFPGYSPQRFVDNAVVELPGIFSNAREASLAYTRMIASGAMKGYDDYVVIAALMSPLESIHARQPIDSLASLKGMSIRTNNPIESAAVAKLGMDPVTMPVNAVAEAFSDDKIKSSTSPLAMLFEFGIGRVATTHYLLDVGSAPLALVMNRAKFDSLPREAQRLITKYSGEWPIASYVADYEAASTRTMQQLRSNPRRNIVIPSQTDQAVADVAFGAVVSEWAAQTPANRGQLDRLNAQLAVIRGPHE